LCCMLEASIGPLLLLNKPRAVLKVLNSVKTTSELVAKMMMELKHLSLSNSVILI